MKQTFFLLLSLSLASFNLHAELLDKVAGVINQEVITLSQLKRIQHTLPARRKLSPYVYLDKKYSLKELLLIQQQTYIVRDKLSAIGIRVSDDNVEERINETEQRLGYKRENLLDLLESEGISFNEYFELTRENIELSIFNSRLIGPLVSITDQQLVNLYYKKSENKNTLTFKYKIIDFYVNYTDQVQQNLGGLPHFLGQYQQTGNLPSFLSGLETNNMGTLAGEDLPPELRNILRVTDEGTFSKPYVRDSVLHIFFVQKKELTESGDFLRVKSALYNELFIEKSEKIKESWFTKEFVNYYILDNL